MTKLQAVVEEKLKSLPDRERRAVNGIAEVFSIYNVSPYDAVGALEFMREMALAAIQEITSKQSVN